MSRHMPTCRVPPVNSWRDQLELFCSWHGTHRKSTYQESECSTINKYVRDPLGDAGPLSYLK